MLIVFHSMLRCIHLHAFMCSLVHIITLLSLFPGQKNKWKQTPQLVAGDYA